MAEFRCTVAANPFNDDTVTWTLPDRPGGILEWRNRKEVIVDPVTKTSTLRLHFVSRDDRGRVVCTANNGVGELEVTESATLTVNREWHDQS